MEYDIIVAGEVIEHLKNPGKFLNTSSENLARDGKLLLTTPNPDGFAYFRKALLDQSNNETHTCWIDPANLDRLLSITDNDLEFADWAYLPPTGGVSAALWRAGLKRAASPGYVAEIIKSSSKRRSEAQS